MAEELTQCGGLNTVIKLYQILPWINLKPRSHSIGAFIELNVNNCLSSTSLDTK